MSNIAVLILEDNVNNQIKKSNLKIILKEMSQAVTQNKRKIKIKSIYFSRYVGSLRVRCLWENFLKENINVTENKTFLCPVHLNYIFLNVHTRIHLYNLIPFKIY